METDDNILLDSFMRRHDYLRISITDRCNLRCKYCIPDENAEFMKSEALLTADEIIRCAAFFVTELGVTKIRITGGEPLVRKECLDIMRRLKAITGLKKLAITTNGLLLKEQLPALKAIGLDSLNISLDTLRPDRFHLMTGRGQFDDVMTAILAAVEQGFHPKLNAVLMKGINDDEVLDFVAFIKDKPIEVRFIEFMPFDDNHWNESKIVSFDEVYSVIAKKHSTKKIQKEKESTSNVFEINGHLGNIGFISSITQNFCAGCNRIRMTADGKVRNCLFAATDDELDLRKILRSGEAENDKTAMLKSAVKALFWKKKFKHAESKELVQIHNRKMIAIGG
jgi:molybdenum cofactor biosynthesis protein A